MEQYISKAAVVAEIVRRIKYDEMVMDHDAQITELISRELNTLYGLLSFIRNIEVKEVDLEKELQELNKEIIDDNGFFDPLDIAKHFFGLGMQVNNTITAADRGTAEEIIINLKRIEQDYRINLTKEIEWVRNKVKKGEEV